MLRFNISIVDVIVCEITTCPHRMRRTLFQNDLIERRHHPEDVADAIIFDDFKGWGEWHIVRGNLYFLTGSIKTIIGETSCAIWGISFKDRMLWLLV